MNGTEEQNQVNNRWVEAGEQVQALVAAEATRPAPPAGPAAVTGTASPQGGVMAPPPGSVGCLRLERVNRAATLWFAGAHGGAGESSLAALEPTWAATGHTWPCRIGPGLDAGAHPCPTVLVARTHAPGLRAAQTALTQWAAGAAGETVDLLGLVLVADAPGRLPKALRELATHVKGGAPRTWNVEWLPEARVGPLDPNNLPKQLRQLVQDLTTLTGPTGLATHRP